MSHHNLESRHYVSERMLKHLNKAIAGMMENGLHRFYTTYSQFILNTRFERGSIEEIEDDVKALSVAQLSRLLKLVLCLLALTLVIFLVEIVMFHARMLLR